MTRDTLYRMSLIFRMAQKNRSLLFTDHRFGLHEPAAGDFLLMHTSLWQKTGSYDEIGVDTYVDSIMLHKARAMGYMQHILPHPIYHIDHANDRKNRPSGSLIEYYRNCIAMNRSKKPYRTNDSNWGYPKESFDEVIL